MKKLCVISHVLANLALMAVSWHTVSAQTLTGQSTDPPGWKTVWYDDFPGTALNLENWNIEENNDGGGNNELQHYGRENVAVRDGSLVITAERRRAYDRDFQSGRITTQKKVYFAHGKLEARIKMPETEQGLWPAFWMLGERGVWPACGEIDVVEMGHKDGWTQPGNNPKAYLNGAFHWGSDYNNHKQLAQTQNEIVVQDGNWHIFTCEWTPEYITMYLDGKQYCSMALNVNDDANPQSVDKYFHKPSFILFNLAVGGMFPDIQNTAGITALPEEGSKKEMLVDWVRIAQPEDDSAYTFMEQYVPEEDTYEPDPDTKTGIWGSKAIDEKGNYTFDLDNATDMVLISTTQGVTEMLKANKKVLADYNPDDINHHMYIWENTYYNIPGATTNSFGFPEGNSVSLAVSGVSNWSGAGFASSDIGKDLSMLNDDDDYVLHFAMRGGDRVGHASHTIIVGNAEFNLGKGSAFGDFPRDGEWYNFDIPVKILRQLKSPLFKEEDPINNFKGNVFAFQSGGIVDTKIQIDNIFFYKSKSPVEGMPEKDDITELGRYGTLALENGNPTFDKANAYDYVPLRMTPSFYEEIRAAGKLTKLNLYEETGTKFYVWQTEGTEIPTYNPGNAAGVNSMGTNEGYTALTVGTGGWSGAAFSLNNEINNRITEEDLRILTDPANNYWFHIAFKANDMLHHASQTISLGNATFSIGPSGSSSVPSLGDYKRDGEWCNFDIPVRDLLVMSPNLLENPDGYNRNFLVFSTGGTEGRELNFDNVFFYRNDKKEVVDQVETTPCGQYMKASLENGQSTFNFENASDIIPIRVSSDVANSGKIRNGYENTVSKINFWPWNADYLNPPVPTFVAGPMEGTNSFGKSGEGEDFISLIVNTVGWSGAALNVSGETPIDLTPVSNEDKYYLHLAIRDKDYITHVPYQLTINGKILKLGKLADGGTTDFTRNGEWYSLDIPVSVINATLFSGANSFSGDLIQFDAGGKQGTVLEIDNVFFYKNLAEEGEEETDPEPSVPSVDASISLTVSAAEVEEETTVTITPEISVPEDVTVEKVEFYIGEEKIGSVKKAPYALDYSLDKAGTISIHAVMTLSDENVITSEPVTVNVTPIDRTEGELKGQPIGSKSEDAYLAFDGKNQTSYSDAGEFLPGSSSPYKPYTWVGLDLGNPYIITEIEWTKAEDSNVQLGIFMGANSEDFSDAKPLHLIKGNESGTAKIDVSKGFRYVKYVGPSGQQCGIAELKFTGKRGKGDDSKFYQVTKLPTVIINTVDGEIPYDKENEISSTTIIIANNEIDIEAAKTGVRERGNASRDFPKKPWRLKFDKSTQILGSKAKGKKWTLINNYGDKTLMRNLLAFDVAEKFGMAYVPFRKSVDVIMNGEYKGSYQLCDQIDVREYRVDIEEMDEKTAVSGLEATGGYFIEVDAYAYDEPNYFESSIYKIPVTIKSPDYNDDNIAQEHKDYITNFFNSIEASLDDTSEEGYRKIFDTESFIKHMLTNEVAGNTDCYWSTYMYKDRDEVEGVSKKMYTGPVWDFDLGFNNDYRTYPVYEKSGYGYLWNIGAASAANGMRTFARKILLDDENTFGEIQTVWQNAKNNGLSAQWIIGQVDKYAELLNDSQELNFLRWPILDSKEHMNPEARGSYAAECEVIKDYITKQMQHLEDVVAGIEPDYIAPSYVPDPEDGADEIFSVYTTYGNNIHYNIGNWGQSTIEKEVKLADGKKAIRLVNHNYQGWEGFNIDVSKYGNMHVDYWTPDDNVEFGFTPISPAGGSNLERTKKFVKGEVKKGEWNRFDVPLSYFTEALVDLENIFQIKFEPGSNNVGYIANVYFWGEPEEGQNPDYPKPLTYPTPEHDADKVFSFFSSYGNNVNYTVGGWGQSTKESTIKVEGQDVLRMLTLNYQGWVGFNIDISDYDYMHVDYWTPTENTTFGFVTTSKHDEQGRDETIDTPIWWAPEVKANEWNSYNVPLTAFSARMAGIEEIKLAANHDNRQADPGISYVANVYFWKEDGKTLRLTAEATEITQNSAVISYNVILPEGFEDAEVDVTISGEPQAVKGNGNQFIATGLTGLTEYTYTLVATARLGEETLTSNEVPVKFTTLRDADSAIAYHFITNDFLPNALYFGEEKLSNSVDYRRELPISIKSEVIYNADKTVTVNFSFTGNENIVGFVPEINVDNFSGSLLNKDINGVYSYTSSVQHEAGDRILIFFYPQYDGGVKRIELPWITLGDPGNAPVEYGEPSSIELRTNNTFVADKPQPFNAYLADQNGNFLLGDKYEPEVSIDENSNFAGGSLSEFKYFIKLSHDGTSTVVAKYGDLPDAELTFTYGSNIAAGKEVILINGENVNDLQFITDEREDDQSITEFKCADTQEHTIRIKLDKFYKIDLVRIVWEGASAKHYDFNFLAEYYDSDIMRAAADEEKKIGVTYSHEVTDGDGGAGKHVVYEHVPAYEAVTNLFELNTYEATEPAWNIKLKQIYLYGSEGIFTGLNEVDMEAPVEYYNLQGIRIMNPGPGLYIKRQGRKVEKVIIK